MKFLRLQQLTIVVAVLIVTALSIFVLSRERVMQKSTSQKLYWFVPDGLRADPDVFTLYRWASEGKLPNIRRMMDEGSYGYSIPVFPSHTPVNFATLFTGVSPKRHGVADGPIRLWDYPLRLVSRSGFSSLAKIIDPFWYTLEQAGMIVSMLSVPGSTPPEITTGNVVKGRWGGWGIEFQNVIFHGARDVAFRKELGWNDKVFQFEKKLTEFTATRPAQDWQIAPPKSFSPLLETNLRNWEADLFVLFVDTTDDGQENYDTIVLSRDKKDTIATLKAGDWTDWFNLDLAYRMNHNFQEAAPQKLELEEKLSELHFSVPTKLRVIKLGKGGDFRLRILYDGLNDSVVVPSTLAEPLHAAAGPMVDFVDSFPPQLIYYPEDKATFMEESDMSFAWHKKAQEYFLREGGQDVFIGSIYSPNQMLTSRWWMGYLDPRSRRYKDVSEPKRAELWGEVLAMYKKVDDMLGQALDARRPDAYVVFSSDHGVAPLNYEVKLNNLFAQKGWLKFSYNKNSQNLEIDWARTQVVFLNMNHIFINPRGLAGNYRPASGPAYENLRKQVANALGELKDANGGAPLAAIHDRESAAEWGLPADRVGDLIIAANVGYGWIEDVSDDGGIFIEALKSGYKQAILPEKESALWTPFMIVGPGVKKGFALPAPIHHVDQYPTVMKILGQTPPYETDGRILTEILGP